MLLPHWSDGRTPRINQKVCKGCELACAVVGQTMTAARDVSGAGDRPRRHASQASMAPATAAPAAAAPAMPATAAAVATVPATATATAIA